MPFYKTIFTRLETREVFFDSLSRVCLRSHTEGIHSMAFFHAGVAMLENMGFYLLANNLVLSLLINIM